MTSSQPTLETWDQKWVRLGQDMVALLKEQPSSVLKPREWRKWNVRYRQLDYEIHLHLRAEDE